MSEKKKQTVSLGARQKEKPETISVVLPEHLLSRLRAIMALTGERKSDVIRDLIQTAMDDPWTLIEVVVGKERLNQALLTATRMDPAVDGLPAGAVIHSVTLDWIDWCTLEADMLKLVGTSQVYFEYHDGEQLRKVSDTSITECEIYPNGQMEVGIIGLGGAGTY